MPKTRNPRGKLRRLGKRGHGEIETTVVIIGGATVLEHHGGPCRVIIRDYDIQDANPRELTRDPAGDPCFEDWFEFPNEGHGQSIFAEGFRYRCKKELDVGEGAVAAQQHATIRHTGVRSAAKRTLKPAKPAISPKR